jgi:hypothetical protein
MTVSGITSGRWKVIYRTASAGVLDSQSVKTATMINQEVGYDAGKRIKGRKRFTLVDTFGLLIAVKVVFCQRFSILLRTFLF